ncbi:ankyrin repeat protein, putative [Trichomonas vaginalis G3]|uniref:Ankyrin repeat protein, putative n=1 Tax=Trichomonas vaginalis (strain ATCC PRA-98 / G3) TaxID=412133 RepID=A2E5B4_TRIV3|nr:ankyrin repeat protein family [Trichomonas vaginalis G3]EAY12194.1 ankyrin repeat protein, putative [Trichomonas vaginalis G3]KAI5515406.1 ankyrin repeat protein family [Trichomonas vaginalis G3]|eukprot:XP_001324417.1 ankyrin repeat protein [Trichomonas vaginalis G3]
MMAIACEEFREKRMMTYVLSDACKKGNLDLVKSLIECNYDIELMNHARETPLMIASRYNKLEVVKYLISVGADKEVKCFYEMTPLICT